MLVSLPEISGDLPDVGQGRESSQRPHAHGAGGAKSSTGGAAKSPRSAGHRGAAEEPECPKSAKSARFGKFCQILGGPFSAVSTATIARIGAFCSFFQDLQD